MYSTVATYFNITKPKVFDEMIENDENNSTQKVMVFPRKKVVKYSPAMLSNDNGAQISNNRLLMLNIHSLNMNFIATESSDDGSTDCLSSMPTNVSIGGDQSSE